MHSFLALLRSGRAGLPALGLLLALLALPLLLGATLRGTLPGDTPDDVNVVRYHARDALSSWSGVAPIAELGLRFDPEALGGGELRAVVPAGAFDSGNFVRDANARRTVFETEAYPEIVFEASALRADPATLPRGAEREVELRGTLAMHGVERELSTVATVTRTAEDEPDRLRAEGEFTVLLSNFDMTRPSFLGVTVEDDVRVSYVVEVALEPTGE